MVLIDELNERGSTKIFQSNPLKSTITLAKELGTIARIESRSVIDELRINSISPLRKNTYGGNYGQGELPLHTDLAHWDTPPRYLLLRCVVPGVDVATRFIHHSNFIKCLPQVLISRAIFKPRRMLDGKKFMLRLKSNGIFRWDSLFLKPVNDDAKEVIEYVSKIEYAEHVENIYLSSPGDSIIFDNWNSLHGRSSVLDQSLGRIIHRVYLSEIFN
jgi:L-asparagine oxygenase